MNEMMEAAKEVSYILKNKLSDVGRVALVFEGFGVDHAHAKLYPLHGTKMRSWHAIHSHVDKYFDKYEGYISTHDYKGVPETEIEDLAEKLRKDYNRHQ